MNINKVYKLLGFGMVIFGLASLVSIYEIRSINNIIIISQFTILSSICIVAGFLAAYFPSYLQNINDDINKIEQIDDDKTNYPKIVITVMPGGVDLKSDNLSFYETVSVLEISKLQMIKKYVSHGIVEIVKNK